MPWTRRWAGASEATVDGSGLARLRPAADDPADAAAGTARVRAGRALRPRAMASLLRKVEHRRRKTARRQHGSSGVVGVDDVAPYPRPTARPGVIRRAPRLPMAARHRPRRIRRLSAKPPPRQSNAAADDRHRREITD